METVQEINKTCIDEKRDSINERYTFCLEYEKTQTNMKGLLEPHEGCLRRAQQLECGY